MKHASFLSEVPLPLLHHTLPRNRTPMSERVIRKKQGVKRARSVSNVAGDVAMEVDSKFQTKKIKPGRDVSGLRDEKQVCFSTLCFKLLF